MNTLTDVSDSEFDANSVSNLGQGANVNGEVVNDLIDRLARKNGSDATKRNRNLRSEQYESWQDLERLARLIAGLVPIRIRYRSETTHGSSIEMFNRPIQQSWLDSLASRHACRGNSVDSRCRSKLKPID